MRSNKPKESYPKPIESSTLAQALSNPPLLQGLHLKTRQMPLAEPITAPCFITDCRVYSEQLGENLQYPFGKNDLYQPWSGDNVFWYPRMSHVTTRRGTCNRFMEII
jgi:hypothetical protein